MLHLISEANEAPDKAKPPRLQPTALFNLPRSLVFVLSLLTREEGVQTDIIAFTLFVTLATFCFF